MHWLWRFSCSQVGQPSRRPMQVTEQESHNSLTGVSAGMPLRSHPIGNCTIPSLTADHNPMAWLTDTDRVMANMVRMATHTMGLVRVLTAVIMAITADRMFVGPLIMAVGTMA